MPRRLTLGQCLEIARERAKGVASKDLAARFEVAPQTINAVARRLRDAPAVEDTGTQVVSVRVSIQELRAFEAAAKSYNLTKTEALRRLMRSATTVLAPDGQTVDGLLTLAAQVNRLGGNLNQVAYVCNEARAQGQRLPYTEASHVQVRAAVDAVWTVVGQIRQMAFGLRGQLDAKVTAALRTEGAVSGTDEPA